MELFRKIARILTGMLAMALLCFGVNFDSNSGPCSAGTHAYNYATAASCAIWATVGQTSYQVAAYLNWHPSLYANAVAEAYLGYDEVEDDEMIVASVYGIPAAPYSEYPCLYQEHVYANGSADFTYASTCNNGLTLEILGNFGGWQYP
jgi:hypothetical protein